MKIYLDNCALQRPFDDKGPLRNRSEAEAIVGIIDFIEAGQAQLMSSEVLFVELFRMPKSERRDFVNCILEQCTIFIEINDDVEQKAEGFVEKGLRAFDATHLASAVSGQANYFCSCDDQLLRIGKNLDTGLTVVVNPLELLERITQ